MLLEETTAGFVLSFKYPGMESCRQLSLVSQAVTCVDHQDAEAVLEL